MGLVVIVALSPAILDHLKRFFDSYRIDFFELRNEQVSILIIQSYESYSFDSFDPLSFPDDRTDYDAQIIKTPEIKSCNSFNIDRPSLSDYPRHKATLFRPISFFS